MALEVCASCSAAYAVGLLACPQCGSTERRGERATPMVPQIEVACQTEGCRAEGKVATVRLPSVGVNLVALPIIQCTLCGAVVVTVTAWPPRAREGDDMPKITRHGGPSIAMVSADGPELFDPPGPDAAVLPAAEPEPEGQEAPGTGEPMTLGEDGQVTGDGTGAALPPIEEEKDEPDAVADPEPEGDDGQEEKKPTRKRSTRAKAEPATAKGSTGK